MLFFFNCFSTAATWGAIVTFMKCWYISFFFTGSFSTKGTATAAAHHAPSNWKIDVSVRPLLFNCYSYIDNIPFNRSWMLSAYMSACACSHSSFPARPCFLARYRAIVFDWASTRPSTSKIGTWPKGVAIWIKDDNQSMGCAEYSKHNTHK